MSDLILLGANGMFGRDAVPVFEHAGWRVHPGDLPEVDIAEPGSLEAFFAGRPGEVVINAAAYTDVDRAESEPEAALRINASGAENVARACLSGGRLLVFISTDYVYPGDRPEGYLPTDPPGPALNRYGESKLEGEARIRRTLPPERLLICRTQWLYGPRGRNFVDTIRSLAASRREIHVVDDQWGVPTHTRDLARQIAALLKIDAAGVRHTVGGGGPITWFELAEEIVRREGSPCRVLPCATEAFPRPAPRPRYGWLRDPGIPPEAVRHWKDSLADHLAGAMGPE